MNIFLESNYKKIMSAFLLHRKKANSRFTFEAMAKACGVQKTYLSKVLKHKGNLNPDQIYSACEYLRFNPLERDYVTALYQLATSEHPKRKEEIAHRVSELRKKALKTEEVLGLKTASPTKDILAEYYADPFYSLIHMFLSIDRFRKNTTLLGPALGLNPSKINHYIERLESMGIIVQENSGWQLLHPTLHLPEGSPFLKAHRNLLRLKAMEKIEKLENPDFYSFTVVFSTNHTVQKEIHRRFLQFLEQIRTLVEKGKEQDVYQLNFDFLKWS